MILFFLAKGGQGAGGFGDLGSGIQPRAVDALLQLFSRSHKAIPAQPDLLTTDLVGLVWPGSWTPLFEQGGPGGTLAGGGKGGL